MARAGVTHSFTGSITEPRQVLQGGYLSWHDPVSDHWFQQRFFDAEPEIADLGAPDRGQGSLREMVDGLTPQTKRLSHLKPKTPQLTGAIKAAASADKASEAWARALRADIEEIKQSSRR